MKKCPYCAEEILDEAVKCKHCGEWLNKPSNQSSDSLSKLISKGLNFIKEQNKKRIENNSKHLFEPTDEHPFILNDFKVFGSYIEFGKKHQYEELMFIVFHNSVQRMNGLKTKEKLVSAYFFVKEDKENQVPETGFIVDCSFQPIFPVFSNSDIEKAIFLNQYLSNRTFENRLNRYLFFLKKDGYFTLGDYRVYNNGDLKTEIGDFELNILEHREKDLIEYGDISWHGLKSYSIDPFKIIFYKNKRPSVKFFGMDFSSKIEIENIHNKDVIDFLLLTLVTNGKILQ